MSAACAILVVWTHADFKHIAVDSRHDGPYIWGDPPGIDSYTGGRAKDWRVNRWMIVVEIASWWCLNLVAVQPILLRHLPLALVYFGSSLFTILQRQLRLYLHLQSQLIVIVIVPLGNYAKLSRTAPRRDGGSVEKILKIETWASTCAFFMNISGVSSPCNT